MTRTPTGWMHEKAMHVQMMTPGSKHFEIFNGGDQSHINSAAVMLGTASALRDAAHNTLSAFYWFPSVANYPGIDGVLANSNDIYALQVTIAETHEVPLEGLKKVWWTIGPDVAWSFTWHFVMVTDKKPLADKYATKLGTQLHDVALGRSKVRVKV